jgi:Ca-activated chloride channel family protein
MKYLPLFVATLTALSAPVWEKPASGQAPQAAVSPYLGSTESATASASGVYGDDHGNSPLLTIHKRVDEVNVVFTATDGRGKFVKNLSQRDFMVLDNHRPPQSILDFQKATDLPLRVGLVVDSSGSVRSRFTFEQNSATQFLQQVVRAGKDRAFIIGFNSHSELMEDFTDNGAKLSEAVAHLHAGGGTALYDAIYLACRDKLLKTKDRHPVRRAVVVLSDGEDNQSQMSLQQAIEMAQRADVIVYPISTDDSGMILRGDGVLQQLADATGGRAFFPYKMSDITKAFSAIEEELRSQYSVAYKPADLAADGRYHSIEIIAQNKKVHVRARPGYYAPRQ